MPKTVKTQAAKDSAKVGLLNESNAVNFLYKTMVERDPKKRKVKPIDKGFDLTSLELFEDTSSDDEDYKPKDLDDDDDDDIDDEEESEEAMDSQDDNESISIVETKDWTPVAEESQKSEVTNNDLKLSTKVPKLLVCSVCLGDVTHENNEIVECDSCGITVHECCYGITSEQENDNESIHSNASSSSTEPWFCDSCKANVAIPVCELCPNSGGIFKHTEVGRWVHLVCALYIPGVAFADTTRLTGVTLFEVPYDRWGSKPCSLCEDERLSRTGISICCDAGLCKTYFHVTCAQAHGLLYEAQTMDETELVDPFYAHCKLHAGDKVAVKAKRRNWLALQSNQRLRNHEQSSGQQLSERIAKKLNKAREKWKMANIIRTPPWVPTQKTPRMLTTCPSAVRKLIRKSELLGLSPQTHYIASHDIDVRRKWYIPPYFSVEFVSYYLDRSNRMNSMQSRLEELELQNKQLKEAEETNRKTYEELLRHCDSLKMDFSKYRSQARDLWSVFSKLSKRSLSIPKILESPEEKKSPKTQKGSSVIKICGTCRKTQDQHQLALCDSCKLYYHLYCLDPPLSRMPKKTRFGGWQCSDCTEKEDTQSDGTHSNQSFIDAPRRLREHVKGPNKFIPDADSIALNAGHPFVKKRKLRKKFAGEKRGRKKKVMVTIATDNSMDSLPNTANGSSSLSHEDCDTSRKLMKIEKLDEQCCKCKETSSVRHLVQCDACFTYIHFSCLNPPQKKSPKRRGYQWLCENCEPSGEESIDEESPEIEELDMTCSE